MVGRSWVVTLDSASSGKCARRRRLEVEQPVRQHALLVQPLAHARLDGAEVLADDERARPLALQRDDRHQLVGARAHVAAALRRPSARGIQNSRNRPITWSMRRPPDVAEHRADRLDERLVAGGAQPVRDERRQAPVLAGGVELVGRRADRDVARQQVLPAPGVGARDVEADRQVVDDGDLLGGARELGVEQPLQPGVEARRARALASRKAAIAVAVGAAAAAPATAASPCRAARPARSRSRSRSAPGPAPPAEPVEAVLAVEAGEDRLQRLHLQLEDRVAVDLRARVERAPGVAQRARACRRPARSQPGHLLDAQEERVARSGGSTGSRATARSGAPASGAVIGFTITTPPPSAAA